MPGGHSVCSWGQCSTIFLKAQGKLFETKHKTMSSLTECVYTALISSSTYFNQAYNPDIAERCWVYT